MAEFNAPKQRHLLIGRTRASATLCVVATVSMFAPAPTIASTRYEEAPRSPPEKPSQFVAQAATERLAQSATPPSPAQPANGPAATSTDKDNEKEKAKQEKEGTPATVVDGEQLESVLGIDAVSSAGEDMGRIVDIIVDHTGQVRAAIIDFGGFLGVGSRKIAVDWRAMHFPSNGKSDTVVVDLTKDQLRVAPVYKPGEPVVVIGRPGAKP